MKLEDAKDHLTYLSNSTDESIPPLTRGMALIINYDKIHGEGALSALMKEVLEHVFECKLPEKDDRNTKI